MDNLERACSYLGNKKLGDVESVGNHDSGIYIVGTCKLFKKECKCLVLDFPRDYKVDFHKCIDYKKGQAEHGIW